MAREIPDKYKKLQKTYKRRESVWRPLHFILGGGAAVLAAVAGAGAAAHGDASFLSEHAALLSWSSAGLAALVTFMQPGARAKAYRSARDVLRFARATYELKEDASEDVLLEAMSQAQSIVRGE